jgi:hypothetical protein
VVKIAVALAFLPLLTVPIAFFRGGYRGALSEAVIVVAFFGLTAYWGHHWVRKARISNALPISLDARLVTGLALTSVFVFLGRAPALLGFLPGVMLSGLQYSVLFGLFSSGMIPPGASAWKPGFWRRREYLPAMLIGAVIAITLVVAFWSVLRWWSLLVPPGALLGNTLGEFIGRSIRQWVLALKEVWGIAVQMGPPIGGFALGYLVIAFIFTGLFAAVWRGDSAAFKGLPEHPQLIDFAYYSVMTISTTGYGDVAPQSPPAKLLASAETLAGLTWTLVVFAAVLTVIQRRLTPGQAGPDQNENDRT